jgi:hypothetical protein
MPFQTPGRLQRCMSSTVPISLLTSLQSWEVCYSNTDYAWVCISRNSTVGFGQFGGAVVRASSLSPLISWVLFSLRAHVKRVVSLSVTEKLSPVGEWLVSWIIIYVYSVKVLRKFLNVRLVNTLTSETNCQLVILQSILPCFLYHTLFQQKKLVYFSSRE